MRGVFSRLHFTGSRKYLGDQMDYTESAGDLGHESEKMEENDVRVLTKNVRKKRLNRIFLSPAVQRTLFMI